MKPQKWNPITHRKDLLLPGMQFEPEPFEKSADLLPPVAQERFALPEEEEVIHVAEIAVNAQFLFHKVIEAIEIEVREKLRREAPDRNPPSEVEGREEIVAGEVAGSAFPVERRVIEYRIREAENPAIGDPPGDRPFQNRVVDGSEVPADIALQDIRKPSRVFLAPVERPVSSLPESAGVRIVDVAPFEERLDRRAEGVMDDAVAERGRGDPPPLRIPNREHSVGGRPIRPADQLFPESEEILLEVRLEGEGILPVPFPPSCPPE